MTGKGRARALACWLGLWLLTAAVVPAQAEELGVYGRVRVSRVESPADPRLEAVRAAVEARYARAPERPVADHRIISVRPLEPGSDRFVATLYDYTVEAAFELLLDATGQEIGREPLAEPLDLDSSELEDALTILEKRSSWSADIAAGVRTLSPAMPPITVDAKGRRLVNVSVIALLGGGGGVATDHEIVSVHIPSGEIVRYASGAPPTSIATLAVCGPPSQNCSATAGSCTSLFHFEWPASNPVWKFDATHPSCTRDTTQYPQGSGLDIHNVKYRDRLVLKRANMPVLNVLYDNNTCGPYRDWLYSENCFQTYGTPIGTTGFMVTSSSFTPPSTFCETGVDAGNFKGVAIHDEGNSLWLITETDAGWYRYVMEWRLHMDGTIEPIVGFGAVINSCVCNAHHHHGYWRLEFALDGDENNQSTGIATLERRVLGSADQWTPIVQETKITRPPGRVHEDQLRIRNQQTGTTYVLTPGREDGSAEGNAYAKGDAWALAYNPNETNDPNTNTSINIDPWLTNEALGASKRLVLWYRAGYYHDLPGGDLEPCELGGPRIALVQPCAGSVKLSAPAYGCSSSIAVTLEDSDLAGRGTQAVTIRSNTEPQGEPLLLVENPAGSGIFTGTYPTTPASPTGGDEMLSVAHGDVVTVDYVDASYCGTSGVLVSKTAAVDCLPPVISNVQVVNATESSFTVSWTTDEPATKALTYGAVPPPTVKIEDLTTYGTVHALTVTGLTPCSTRWFSVSSVDAVGNVATEDNAGGFFSFATNGRGYRAGPDDAESGIDAWTVTGTGGSAWHVSPCRASSPTRSFRAGSSATCPGTYGNNVNTYLTSPSFSLGAQGHGYRLRFREYYKTQSGGDFCRPQISTDGGATWKNLAQYSGNGATWAQKDYDLAEYTGNDVRIRFWFSSNSFVIDEGWYIDDIEVSRSAPCTAALERAMHSVTDACAADFGNAAIDPGEDVLLTLTARNFGLAPATNVSATLTSSTPGVTVTESRVSFPDIPADGAMAVGAAPFAFTVGSAVPCGSAIDLTATFSSAEGVWSSQFAALVGQGGTAVRTYDAVDVPRPIPDLTTVTSSITVTDTAPVADVNVGVDIQHSFDSDLDIFLIAPNGTRVELSTDNGGAGQNYTGTLFDDQAAISITSGTAPFTGSYRPEGALSVLNGMPANGVWTLEVSDDAWPDAGTLLSWFVELSTTTAPTCSNCDVTAPAETGSLFWSEGSLASLEWTPAPGARWYTLWRGTAVDLPNLLTGAVPNACERWIGTATATGGILTEIPGSDGWFWYLVTAGNSGGIGPAGAATGGPRVLKPGGPCP